MAQEQVTQEGLDALAEYAEYRIRSNKRQGFSHVRLTIEAAEALRGTAHRLASTTAQAEAAEKMAEALREASDQLWLLAKDKDDNPWVKQCREALSTWESCKQ
jgi:hypothetical protein